MSRPGRTRTAARGRPGRRLGVDRRSRRCDRRSLRRSRQRRSGRVRTDAWCGVHAVSPSRQQNRRATPAILPPDAAAVGVPLVLPARSPWATSGSCATASAGCPGSGSGDLGYRTMGGSTHRRDMRPRQNAESPPPIAVEVGDGLQQDPDTEARPLGRGGGLADLRLRVPGRFGELRGFPLPLPPTARCGLEANPSLGLLLLSKVQFTPGSKYQRAERFIGKSATAVALRSFSKRQHLAVNRHGCELRRRRGSPGGPANRSLRRLGCRARARRLPSPAVEREGTSVPRQTTTIEPWPTISDLGSSPVARAERGTKGKVSGPSCATGLRVSSGSIAGCERRSWRLGPRRLRLEPSGATSRPRKLRETHLEAGWRQSRHW